MKINFSKMHGIGNDFMVIDAINQTIDLSTEQIQQLADRHFGIGFDQLLLIESPETAGVDFKYRIFNNDGGEVEQCGNGIRCFARYVRDHGLSDKNQFKVETSSGIVEPYVQDNELITVDMGAPILHPAGIPFVADAQAERYRLMINGITHTFGAVSMGNPHAVLQVDNIDTAHVDTTAPAIQTHQQFPQGVNVGFMQVISANEIRLRVHERGTGETLACGTGACAAVVIGRMQGILDETVAVHLTGGTLNISWPGNGHSVMMTGPAEEVFQGVIEI